MQRKETAFVQLKKKKPVWPRESVHTPHLVVDLYCSTYSSLIPQFDFTLLAKMEVKTNLEWRRTNLIRADCIQSSIIADNCQSLNSDWEGKVGIAEFVRILHISKQASTNWNFIQGWSAFWLRKISCLPFSKATFPSYKYMRTPEQNRKHTNKLAFLPVDKAYYSLWIN